jgi:hypothetical protein
MMGVTIDEVTSDIDMPVRETGMDASDPNDAPGSSSGDADYTLSDAITRLQKRHLRLTAD